MKNAQEPPYMHLNKFEKLRITFSMIARESGEWQAPFLKLPQVPKGVPKLANFMVDIDSPASHLR